MKNFCGLADALNTSWEFIRLDREQFYTLFYSKMLSYDHISKLFQDISIEDQKRMLHKALELVMGYNITSDGRWINELAHKHFLRGVKSGDYELFLNCFLETLKERYPHYNDECATAWKVALAPGLQLMANYQS